MFFIETTFKDGSHVSNGYCPVCCEKPRFLGSLTPAQLSAAEAVYGRRLLCEKCNKVLDFMDLLDESELKNIKRTELIDKILK